MVHLGSGFTGVDLPQRLAEAGPAVVRAGAAVALPVLARRVADAGWSGLSWAVGVPGSVGGAVRMNAGGHGADMASCLARYSWVDLFGDAGGSDEVGRLDYGYRSSSVGASQLVVAAELSVSAGSVLEEQAAVRAIVRWRRAHQPGGSNAGSVFANPDGDSAGRLIEGAGLKGFRMGTAHMSRRSTPISFRRTRAVGPTTCTRSWRTSGGWWPSRPGSRCGPRSACSASATGKMGRWTGTAADRAWDGPGRAVSPDGTVGGQGATNGKGAASGDMACGVLDRAGTGPEPHGPAYLGPADGGHQGAGPAAADHRRRRARHRGPPRRRMVPSPHGPLLGALRERDRQRARVRGASGDAGRTGRPAAAARRRRGRGGGPPGRAAVGTRGDGARVVARRRPHRGDRGDGPLSPPARRPASGSCSATTAGCSASRRPARRACCS